jgi:putative oxidoreductase
MTIALWVVQGLFAVLFLPAGIAKAFLPLPTVKKRFPWANHVPPGLTRFIGGAELLGALGLILPAVTGILPWLTIAAAVGFVLVMLCAAVFHASRREFSAIGVNVVLMGLSLFVAVGWVLWAPM